jgi:hypothetical protein
VQELRTKKLRGQHNVDEHESRVAFVLAEKEIPASNDVDAQLTTELLNWEATDEAIKTLKPKLAAAKREASDKILVSISLTTMLL